MLYLRTGANLITFWKKICRVLEGKILNIFSLAIISHLQLRLKKHNTFAILVEFRHAFDSKNHN